MARILVPRTRAGKQWTEARYWAFIRSALRGAWGRYPVKFQVKLANRRTVYGQKHKYEYNCKFCNDWFQDKETQVDHKRPAGTLKTYEDLPKFVENLFCEANNLQILCKPCHQVKTNQERAERKKNDGKGK